MRCGPRDRLAKASPHGLRGDESLPGRLVVGFAHTISSCRAALFDRLRVLCSKGSRMVMKASVAIHERNLSTWVSRLADALLIVLAHLIATFFRDDATLIDVKGSVATLLGVIIRSEEHTSELQSRLHLV